MPQSQYCKKVSANRGALPFSPMLDFPDYMLAICGISRKSLKELTKEETFLACVTRYSASRGVRFLGNLALFVAQHRSALEPVLSEDETVDCIRIGAYCSDLPSADTRYVPLDFEKWPRKFPDLFPHIPAGSSENADYQQRLLKQLGKFAADHPLRLESHPSFVGQTDRLDYIHYWIVRSEEQISEYFKNERFVAALQAMSEGLLSFHGMLEAVYGRTYCDQVLEARQYALFSNLAPSLTALAVGVLARQIRQGKRKVPEGLRERYPEVFRFRAPEAFGRRDE